MMGKNNVWWPILWSLKYFLKDMPAIPICVNKFKTLLGEPPDTIIPKLSRKLPTGIFGHGTIGWLHHTFSLLLQLLFPQTVETCVVSTSELSDLQDGQMLNSSNSWERKTMYFGSVRMSVLFGRFIMERRELIILFIK